MDKAEEITPIETVLTMFSSYNIEVFSQWLDANRKELLEAENKKVQEAVLEALEKELFNWEFFVSNKEKTPINEPILKEYIREFIKEQIMELTKQRNK